MDNPKVPRRTHEPDEMAKTEQQPNTKQTTTTSAHAPIDKLQTKIETLLIEEAAIGRSRPSLPIPIRSKVHFRYLLLFPTLDNVLCIQRNVVTGEVVVRKAGYAS